MSVTDDMTTQLWRDYQHGLDYQVQSGLSRDLPMFVRFWEGKQWPAPTKATRNLPRPVVNIIKMICRNKKAAILSSRVRCVYRSSRPDVDVTSFNRFADYITHELGQEELDKRGVNDATRKGTYVYHYYWDAEARGLSGTRTGGLRCELIDPLSIFFADPTEIDEQKQRWIIISCRESVASVRAKADKGVNKDDIVADGRPEEDRYETVEQEGDELCTVLIRYFRRGGEVWCEKATRTCVVNEPFPITPDVDGALRELGGEDGDGIDAPNGTLPDDPAEEASGEGRSLLPRRARATLYPIVVGNYEPRQGSIFGIGEVEGLIPNQKAINFNLAMLLLNSQQMAWGKYVVLPKALGDQVINNEPGQVLEDRTGTGNGIKRLAETGMSAQPLQLVETITSLSRSVTGSSEVMTGETMGANMSGAAIAQLQSQAQMPIQDLRDSFWRVKEKQGYVLAQFFKLFYRDAEYTYEASEQEMAEMGDAAGGGASLQGGTALRTARFSGADYADVDFEVICEAMSGTKFSAAGDINVLDVLFSKGAISLRTYIEAYPEDAISNKAKILEGMTRDENAQLAAMQQQMAQMQAQLTESAALIERQKETVDRAVACIQENSRLKAMMLELQREAVEKIGTANAEIEAGNRAIAEATDDASYFAQILNNMAREAGAMAGGGGGMPMPAETADG